MKTYCGYAMPLQGSLRHEGTEHLSQQTLTTLLAHLEQGYIQMGIPRQTTLHQATNNPVIIKRMEKLS